MCKIKYTKFNCDKICSFYVKYFKYFKKYQKKFLGGDPPSLVGLTQCRFFQRLILIPYFNRALRSEQSGAVFKDSESLITTSIFHHANYHERFFMQTWCYLREGFSITWSTSLTWQIHCPYLIPDVIYHKLSTLIVVFTFMHQMALWSVLSLY